MNKSSLWNDLIEKEVGAPVPTPCGPYVLLKIFKRDEQTKSGLLIPPSVLEQEKYQNRVGKVLAMGNEAYDPARFKFGPRCEIGDWVIYRRYEIALLTVNGIELGFLFDDKICLTIDSPDQLDDVRFVGRN